MIKSFHYKHLSRKWIKKHKEIQKKLWRKHSDSLNWISNNYKQLVAGSLGGLMLLSNANINLPTSAAKTSENIIPNIDKKTFLISDLSKILPIEVRPLDTNQEQEISQILGRDFGLKITPEIDGKRLDRNYGLIGAEQHLARYPGDNMITHFDSQGEANTYWLSGMASGLGAFGYFAPSKESLTEKDNMREKYYIAVQTFLSKDFNNRFVEYRDFYKYRKMLVVNPNNGKAIVCDIADAGPAEWTGKHLGGSPEVMKYLERADGRERGPVLYFFIDDADDKIPLGPINPK